MMEEKKKRIPRGYKQAFRTVYESKGRDCDGSKELCLKCELFSVCGTNKSSEEDDLYKMVKPYFE